MIRSYIQQNQWLKSTLWLVGGSLFACLLVCYFFAPRFVIWQGLNIPEAWFNPEVNRAVDTLKQLENPRVKIENPSNQVINWRLLFPYIGHYLHFPQWLYLTLPHLGCLLAVGYMFRLLWRRTDNWLWAFMGVCCLATSDWFFVSIGWLTYFDSWFVLGMLLIGFSPSRVALVLACLCAPWVDERFILALIGCVVVRWFYQRDWQDRSLKDLVVDYLLIAIFVLPYVIFRIYFTLTQDVGSANYLGETWNMMSQLSWVRFVEGFWAGFRAAWLFLVAYGVMTWKYGSRLAGVAILFIIAGLIGIALVVAGDISRSMAMLLPVCLLGLLWLVSHQPDWGRIVLPVVFFANLLLPAEHVISKFKVPIYYFYHELDSWQNPPVYLNPIAHLNEGMKLLDAGRIVEARHFFNNAIRLNPRLPEAYLGRGVTYLSKQDFGGAKLDFNQALQLRPQWTDALYFRGLAHAKNGSPLAAVNDLRSALQLSPSDWPHRQECQNALNQLGVK